MSASLSLGSPASLTLLDAGEARGIRTAAGWILAILVVVALHVGLASLALMLSRSAAELPGAPPDVVQVEFAPLPVAPAQAEVAPGPKQQQAETTPPPQVDDRQIEPPPDPPPSEAMPNEVQLADPPRQPDPIPSTLPADRPAEVVLPDNPPVPNAVAVLAPSTPTAAPMPPAPVSPRPPRPSQPPKPVQRPTPERSVRRPIETARTRADATIAPPQASSRASAAGSPWAGATANPGAVASWRAQLAAHLNRYKRFPPGASTGTASVRFTVGRGGQVLSAALSGSSGDPALDAEAVGMVRRASPVPAPPDAMAGTVSLSVPVRFSR